MTHLATFFSLVTMIATAFAATSSPPPPPAVTKVLGLFDRLRDPQSDNAQGNNVQGNNVQGDRHVAFQLGESEVNDYLRYALKTTPRPGFDSVTVKFFPADYISTFTTIDFDAVEKWHPGIIPAVLRPFLKGKKSVWIDCRIHAVDSRLTFTIEKARYNDVPMPAFFVEKMIQIVAARQPEKYDTSKPVPLPFGLVAVSTNERLFQGHN